MYIYMIIYVYVDPGKRGSISDIYYIPYCYVLYIYMIIYVYVDPGKRDAQYVIYTLLLCPVYNHICIC